MEQYRDGFRLPSGFRDTPPHEMQTRRHVVARMEQVCKLYGFVPLDTSTLQLADAIGTYDAATEDRPHRNVFSLKDANEQWLALRVELTPCLMRSFSQSRNNLRLPLRCYQFGTVWRRRTGKLDRRRALDHFDVDLVGVAAPIGDAELCGLACALLDGLGFERCDYHVRVFNRQVVAALLEAVGEREPMACWRPDGTLAPVLAAMDAAHSHDLTEVRRMLTEGLPDSWGDLYRGAGLTESEADLVIAFLQAASDDRATVVSRLRSLFTTSDRASSSVMELDAMDRCLNAFGLDSDRVMYDPAFVRGPSFYNGTTLEVVMHNEPSTDGTDLMRGKERLRRAVAYGGRYAFPAAPMKRTETAVGMSVDLDRLMLRIKNTVQDSGSPVVVTLLEQLRSNDYIGMVRELRMAGVAAELACTEGPFFKQLQYADRRGARLAIICGDDEFTTGHVLIRDLWRGKERSFGIRDRKEWLSQSRTAQVSVPRQEMVEMVRRMLEL